MLAVGREMERVPCLEKEGLVVEHQRDLTVEHKAHFLADVMDLAIARSVGLDDVDVALQHVPRLVGDDPLEAQAVNRHPIGPPIGVQKGL